MIYNESNKAAHRPPCLLIEPVMNKFLSRALDWTLVSLLLTGCGFTAMPAPMSTLPVPSAAPVTTETRPFTPVSSPHAPVVPSDRSPVPFEALSEIPAGEFLFLYLHDDDFTCLDGMCACPVSEMPPESFRFSGDKLLLLKFHFQSVPEDWTAFRRDRHAGVLYNFYGSQFAEFRLFSSLPLATPAGHFVLGGVNSRGEVQVESRGETSVIGVGGQATSEEPEQKDEGCKVLHKYSLTNYGFIKDENVELVTGW